jgi:hypothetical protein
VYLATNIAAVLSEIVAVKICGKKRRDRHPKGVVASWRKGKCHGIFDMAADGGNREHILATHQDVGAYSELVCSIGGIVLAIAAKPPQGRCPEVIDSDPIFKRRRVSAVLGIATAAGFSLEADW